MTRKEFIFKTVISMAANPEFVDWMTDEEDEDVEYPVLKCDLVWANAEDLADCMETYDYKFDEEAN